jgi:cytoskeleton protein RodZ
MAVEAGGIGTRLRAGREKLGLTVLQVAERIHTDPKIVEAIEAENFEALGAPVYARGHIGHYAELVGESGSELNQLYSNVSKVAQPDLTRIVKAPAGTSSSKLVAPALLVIAVFAVAGAVWWVSALSKKKPQLSETHVVGEEAPTAGAAGTEPSPSATEPTQEPAPPSRAVNAGAASTAAPPRSGTTGSGSTTSAAPRSETTGSSASAGTSAPQRLAAASSTRTASSVPAPAQTRTASSQQRTASARPPPATAAGAPAATAPPRAKNQAQVTLRYSADSWTEVYDASGARLFYDVGAANSVQTVVGTPPLRVVLGNASGVSVEYNGHSKPISKLSRPDGSVQFSINRSGQVVRAKPVTDGG